MRHFLRGSELRDIRLRLCREALVWKDLNHPNILPFIGIDRETFPNSLCMVSPWMENGTVLKYLDVHGRANVDKLLFEIAQGIQYLHSRNIVHGDLRGANILIKEDWVACLADFGLSSFTDAASKTHTSNRAGSMHWMAPELIDPDRFGLKFLRTSATDIYVFGCVCFELYAARPPFSELSETAALFKIIAGERAQRPDGELMISDDLWNAITTYWAGDPASRPAIDTVLQNPVWPNPKPTAVPKRQKSAELQVTFQHVPVPQTDYTAPGISTRRRFNAALEALSNRSSPTPTPPQNKKVQSPPAPSPSSPSSSGIAVYRCSESPSSKVFGVDLKESLKYASKRLWTTGENGELREWGFVPVVIAKCGILLKERETPGIFHRNHSYNAHT
ncbi:kinase-like domain-containing protein [Roridomyces roridus]|uniref:Kinase-like domain-containing protein n=1 Tax=Roridomyces roridus TaxID=1738132 RepID=A0AAD7B1P2_9AGAR|nr:kinase-like domain-containing protein [Roridomyces roridus]